MYSLASRAKTDQELRRLNRTMFTFTILFSLLTICAPAILVLSKNDQDLSDKIPDYFGVFMSIVIIIIGKSIKSWFSKLTNRIIYFSEKVQMVIRNQQ